MKHILRTAALPGAVIVVLTVSELPSNAAILTVDSNADTTVVNADCTLREAVIEASRTAGAAVYVECGMPTIGGGDQVEFDPALAGSTIVVGSAIELENDDSTVIDGVGSGVIVDGTGLVADSVFLVTADSCVIRGVTILGGFYGIETLATTATLIGGNNAADGNLIRDASQAGVGIFNGTGTILRRNTIIHNDVAGVWASGETNASIERNRIGLDAAGNIAGNGEGVFANNTTGLTISTNIISGNDGWGVRLGDAVATLVANRIGVDSAANVAKPNDAHGVYVQDGCDVTIGGPAAADRNWISGNGFSGVYIDGDTSVVLLQLNRIGTNSAGTAAIANGNGGVRIFGAAEATLIQNLISGNGGYGVDLVSGGVITLEQNRIGVTPAMAALPNITGGVVTHDEILLDRNVIAFHNGAGDIGIHVEAGGDVLVGSEENCITGNTTGLLDDTSSDISIVNSWWGDASGPSDLGGGSGDPLTSLDFFGVTAYAPVQAAPSIVCP